MAQSKLSTKVQYFVRSISGLMMTDRMTCPDCGGRKSQLIKRKALVTQLRRCEDCELLFRAPTDPKEIGRSFYQTEYRSGFTTDCPEDAALSILKSQRFVGSGKDFSSKIALFRSLGIEPGTHRILDFGASWGYGTWQFQEAGFEVVGLEISEPRSRYGKEKLGVDLRTQVEETERFDVFFSSHVIEHFSRPSLAVSQARQLLKPGGWFIAYTPNGSAECMASSPASYHRSWGGVHPSYLDERYWLRAFSMERKIICSTPVDQSRLRAWDRSSDLVFNLTGEELLIAAQLN